MCKTINNNGEEILMDNNNKDKIMSANEKFAKLGRRVLAFSYYEVPLSSENEFFEKYTDQ